MLVQLEARSSKAARKSRDNGLMRDSHLAEPNESRFDHHLAFRLVAAA
jgi:hypothetical protein